MLSLVAEGAERRIPRCPLPSQGAQVYVKRQAGVDFGNTASMGRNGVRCTARAPAIRKGKEIVMVLPFSKSPYYRTAILFWFSMSLAGQLLGPLPIMSQAAPTLPSQGVSPIRQEHERIIRETAAQAASGAQSNQESSPSSPSGKKQRAILRANFAQLKRDAGDLADLAKALQDELNKSNENLLPLGVVEKANKIEKLAKRIKGSARGF